MVACAAALLQLNCLKHKNARLPGAGSAQRALSVVSVIAPGPQQPGVCEQSDQRNCMNN